MGLIKAVAEGTKTAADLASITKCDERLIGMTLPPDSKARSAQAKNLSSYLETTLLPGNLLGGGIPNVWPYSNHQSADGSCRWWCV